MKRTIILVILVLAAGCAVQDHTIDESRQAARSFIENSPTYSYDGISLSLINEKVLECDDCYLFIFGFNSTHAGYGNRSDKMTAQVITEHFADVVVSEGKVVQAIIDNEWNEQSQNMLEDYELANTTGTVPVYFCPDNNQRECSNDEDVVCSDEKKEFDNGCNACQNNAEWYTKGECSLGYTDKAIRDLAQGKITKESSNLLILIGWYG